MHSSFLLVLLSASLVIAAPSYSNKCKPKTSYGAPPMTTPPMNPTNPPQVPTNPPQEPTPPIPVPNPVQVSPIGGACSTDPILNQRCETGLTCGAQGVCEAETVGTVAENGECDAVNLCIAGLACAPQGRCFALSGNEGNCGAASAVCDATQWCQQVQSGDSSCFPLGALP
jgi:hypothetical protein